MSADCLSDALERATIKPDPFPHVVVPDALDPSLYRQLSASFPPFARIGWDDPALSPRSNARFELSAASLLDDAATPQVWKSFAAAHSDRTFFVVAARPASRHPQSHLLGPVLLPLPGGRFVGRRPAAVPLEGRSCSPHRFL